MANFEKLKIGALISGAFAALAALIVLMGGTSLLRVTSVSHDFDTVMNDRYPKIASLQIISNNLQASARSQRDLLLLTDSDDVKKELDSIKARQSDNSQRLEKLQSQIRSESGKAALDVVTAARAEYSPISERYLSTVMKNQEMAKTVLQSELVAAQNKYINSLQELVKLQEQLMQDSRNTAEAGISSIRNTVLVTGALALLAAVVFAVALTRRVTEPLSRSVTTLRAIAAGDLAVRFDTAGQGETGILLRTLKEMQSSLASVVAQVRRGSEGVATASAEISQGNSDLSSRTESQASALEETAASMEELAATVRQNADSANQANQLARNASTVAVQGGEVVNQVVDTMKGINDASRKISDIISVIDGIAFQTNILALNAAVEAARAGEQGRGFAVVASEVRSLAGRSAEAAKEIKFLINASVERVEAGTALVDRAGTTMTEVVSSIRRVTDIVAEITAASSEQASGVAQVGEAVTQMDQATQQNAALVEEMAAAAISLKSQAQDLVEVVAAFKLEESNYPQLT
jgi:methyl-accepting chemotaxis protein